MKGSGGRAKQIALPTEPGCGGPSHTEAGSGRAEERWWVGAGLGDVQGYQLAPQHCAGSVLADRLLSLTLLAFEGLNTATSKDRCLACIEEPFFSPLWPLLLALYRCRPSSSPLPGSPCATAPSPPWAHL